jgi:hypothetical protein
MMATSLPRMRGWGNRHRPCQAPWDRLRLRGVGCSLAWSSLVFPRRVRQKVPDTTRFLARPRLLTRSVPLSTGRGSPPSPSSSKMQASRRHQRGEQ